MGERATAGLEELSASEQASLNAFKKMQTRMRSELMPSGKEIAEEAITACGLTPVTVTRDDARSNFSYYLRNVSEVEFTIYRQYERACSIQIMSRLMELERPAVEHIVESTFGYDSGVGNLENFIQAFGRCYERFYNHFQAFYNSLANSRKTRAGGSFEIQLGRLLNLAGYDYRPHSSGKGTKGTRIDLILPNDESLLRDYPSLCMGLSAKRTTRERWLNAVKELSDLGIGNIYLCTLENADEISAKKVKEMNDSKVQVVVYKDVKESTLLKNHNAFSYEQMVNLRIPSTLQQLASMGLLESS